VRPGARFQQANPRHCRHLRRRSGLAKPGLLQGRPQKCKDDPYHFHQRPVSHWGFADRAQGIDVALHHLTQQTANGLAWVDEPAWVNGGLVKSATGDVVIGVRLPQDVMEVIDRYFRTSAYSINTA